MTEQNWTNIGGAEAFQLIERHAEDWADAGRMMGAWRDAQTARLNAEWMAKCEELRDKVIEECAKAAAAENLISLTDMADDIAYGYAVLHCAHAIRALSKKEGA